MTLQQFNKALKDVCKDTYEVAAPEDVLRYVVWHQYGTASMFGDNRNVLGIPRVQIDIVTNDPLDFLADDVFAALWSMGLSYSIESEGYDPEYSAFRTILQLEVC